MEILIQVTQLILSLSILVIFHELGHFTFAKLFGTRVEKFYLFFNPWFSLFKIKRGDTEYGVGWVPLGGYVKISGMIDESMDKEQMKKPPQAWEFRSKPAWQRLLIMVGGVLVNFILAICIYIGMLNVYGEQYLPTENVKYGITCDSLALEIGFCNGDKIISVNNEKVENFDKIFAEIILNKPKNIVVERDGQLKEIKITDETIAKIIKHNKPFFDLRFPFIAGDFTENSAAKKAGMQVGDKICGLNGQKIEFFDEFRDKIGDYKNMEVVVSVERSNEEVELTMTIPEEGVIGVYPRGNLGEFFEFETIDYSFAQSVPAGISKGYKEIGDFLKQLRILFSPKTEAYKSLGGFIAIGKIFPSDWQWQIFWRLTAFLSIMLGVINILPIPALDGGHVLFLMYEIITGKAPGDKFLEYAQITGMIILLILVVFANGNDIVKLFN
jgi:regulator of sigma E protease